MEGTAAPDAPWATRQLGAAHGVMAAAMEAWAELEMRQAASMGPMAIFLIPLILAVEEAQTLVLEAMVEEWCGLRH